ncbi:MAG: Crp/Fnr family transcriptional regulator [Pseudomonadota bacterium]
MSNPSISVANGSAQGPKNRLKNRPATCSDCSIRHSSLCSALSPHELSDLNSIARRKSLEPGQPHVMEGAASRDFANVTSGVAKLVRGAEDGRSQIVGLLFASDFIYGSLGVKEPTAAPHSIEAVSQLELCIFPRIPFEELLHDYPSLEFKLLNLVLDELQIAREWMVLLGRKTAEERVASFFLYVTQKMQNLGCQDQISFDLPLGRADIADYVGLTFETVSRQITRLKKDGVITFEGTKRLTHLDEAELKRRAGF